ncbi:uncharacterized protein M421DRAFT_420164 [Didymella exigua CBS 183.55]|uniref:Uncharacterized protein n=1 Tax=Didymella exigua CBS 183.55 TaxID=1150837 RepID=A0A6A5RRM3_9PLEO|nr:uncharacterized protein M421DRAFT_420164 [Didymella exigua CBS 183.55]KAF1928936.1 hypothetical protein M421DRAFT_420164 [Didymella exigua CBS 183.55]
MAAANGTLTPPSLPPAPESPSLAKRKHAHTAVVLSNGASAATPKKAANASTHTLSAVLLDILYVLKGYDTQPSILTHVVPTTAPRSSSGEADTKRAKLAEPTNSATITERVQKCAYESLQAFEMDVESVAADISARSGASDAPATLEEKKLQAKVLAFQKVVKSLVEREEARSVHAEQDQASIVAAAEAVTLEDALVHIKEEDEEHAKEPTSRTVLTLFGTAQGPKQLFSSLQQPRKIAPADGIPSFDASVRVTLPLRETTLPQNIQTTEVFPLLDQTDEKKKKVTTIGEVFRAPAHLPHISPPKIARPTTSKGNTITFAHPEPTKPKRKGSQSYAHQGLSAGFWLGYGGIDAPKDQTSPTARQKSRQRALSTGEAQQPPSEAILVAVQQAKEDALFRSAYSSFAPTRDDANAIVPEETKNRVWWQKVGEKRFNEVFPIDPQLLDADELVEGQANGAAGEEEDFKDAVEKFVPVESNIFTEEKSEHDKDIDEILKDVSELIETLASHQRIRNSSLTTNSRTPVVQNSSLAQLVGSPSTPSTDEIDVYQILKSQLTLMISQLPPYAVAKLNGDQLEELNISRTILFDTKEYNGVMEEDQLSRLATAPAVAAVPPPALTRASSSSQSLYPVGGTQYARPPSSARPVQAAPAYHSQRSASIQYQRSPSGTAQGFQVGAGSFAPSSRSGYAATPSHNLQTPRPGGQYYQQRPSQSGSYGGAANSQFYQGTPQTQGQNRYTAQQSQNGYYQRSTNVAPMYGTPQARTGSPMKPGAPATPSGYGTRTGYAPTGGQMASTYYGPSQYGTPQAPVTRTGYTTLSSNPQQMILDRQQAQVAAQSQARLAAQNSFSSRQGSGTPQPPNGSYGAPNGTSMST